MSKNNCNSSIISLKAACLDKIRFSDLCLVPDVILDDLRFHPDTNLLENFEPDIHLVFNAARFGHIGIVEEFLSNPSNRTTHNFSVSFINACSGGHLEIAELLISNPMTDPSYMDNSAIKFASCHDNTEIIKLLLKSKKVDPTSGDNLSIINACVEKSLESIKILISDPRVYSTVDFYQILRFSGLSTPNIQIAEYIFDIAKESKLISTDNNNYLLYSSCVYNNPNIVKLLLTLENIEPSFSLNICLETAKYNGCQEICNLLESDPRFIPG